MCRKNSILGLSEPEKMLNFSIFYSHEHFIIMLSWVELEKSFLSSGQVVELMTWDFKVFSASVTGLFIMFLEKV